MMMSFLVIIITITGTIMFAAALCPPHTQAFCPFEMETAKERKRQGKYIVNGSGDKMNRKKVLVWIWVKYIIIIIMLLVSVLLLILLTFSRILLAGNFGLETFCVFQFVGIREYKSK